MKKLNIMNLSVLVNSFFPVKVTVRKTTVGVLLSHSPHNTAGVPTLSGKVTKLRNCNTEILNTEIDKNRQKQFFEVKFKHIPEDVDANPIQIEDNKY